jgi:DNA ligase-1
MKPNQPRPLRRLLALLLLSGALQTFPSAHAADHAVPNTALIAPPVLLAQTYSDKYDVADYLVSEKLDGVRALWDGKNLRFRSGRLIHAPTWFITPLPVHPLDGELWMGRETFERLSAAVRRHAPLESEWKTVIYQVYELPGGEGSFSARIAAILRR